MTQIPKDETLVTNIQKIGAETGGKQAFLVFLTGPLVGKIHVLADGDVVVGRSPDVDIPINDPGISRRHFKIHVDGAKAVLKDLGSTNGTHVNGEKVTELALADGDKIQISSRSILKFSYQDKVENVFHEELYKMAIIDPLTGIFNKRYLSDRMKDEFGHALRTESPLTLLMIDIDHFKKINDTHGHPAGDIVLQRLALVAKSVVRGDDIFARFGGEEFCMLLRNTDPVGAKILAERLRNLIQGTRFEFEDKEIPVTVSIGAATLKDGNFTDADTLLKAADDALYISKESGRNRVTASTL